MTMSPNDIVAYAQSIQTPKSTQATGMQNHVINDSDDTRTLLQYHNKEYTIPTNKLADIHAILNIVHPNAPHRIIFNVHPNAFEQNILIYSDQDTPNTFSIETPNHHNKNNHYVINTHKIPSISCTDISILEGMNKIYTRINEYFDNIFSPNNNACIMRYNHGISYVTNEIPHYPNIKFIGDIHGHDTDNHLIVEVSIEYDNDSIFCTSFTIPPNKINNINASYDQAVQEMMTHIKNHPEIYTHQKSQHYYISLIHAMGPYLTRQDSPLRTNIRRCAQELLDHYTYAS